MHLCVTESERGESVRDFKGRRPGLCRDPQRTSQPTGLKRSARRSLGGEQEGDSSSLSEQGLKNLAFVPL